MIARETVSLKFVRLSDRPLVGRIVALSVGISLLMAVGVTAIGYSNASRGLNDQGEARLASDAYVLTSALDRWNLERLEATHALANVKALGRALDVGSVHTPEDEATVKRLHRDGGATRLVPENPSMEPIEFRDGRILGRVVAVLRRV